MFVLDIPRYHSTPHLGTAAIPLPRVRAPRNQQRSTRTNARRIRGIRSLFSCMFPRSNSNIHHENRWDQCVQLDSRCKTMSKRLIVKTIGEGGIAFDSAEIMSNRNLSKPSFQVCNQISYRETKSMDSDDSLNEDAPSDCFIMCQEEPMKIGIPCFQVRREKHDKMYQPSTQTMSRRSIDCSQECPICWETFKVKEKVCWSRNVNCRHGFHLDCMLVWLKDHEQCPLCRCDYMRRK